MTDEQAFLAALAAAPDDEAPHKVFADWLDEQGRPEEAAYHRRWTKAVRDAEDWLRVNVHEKYGLYAADWKESVRLIVEDNLCHGSSSLMDDLEDDEHFRADVFENWQTATGKRVRLRDVVNKYFRCSC
jgi:uncharacterized protein (TIGR02996 family)